MPSSFRLFWRGSGTTSCRLSAEVASPRGSERGAAVLAHCPPRATTFAESEPAPTERENFASLHHFCAPAACCLPPKILHKLKAVTASPMSPVAPLYPTRKQSLNFRAAPGPHSRPCSASSLAIQVFAPAWLTQGKGTPTSTQEQWVSLKKQTQETHAWLLPALGAACAAPWKREVRTRPTAERGSVQPDTNAPPPRFSPLTEAFAANNRRGVG